jgi:F-type H+-transporting ATPase subunit a
MGELGRLHQLIIPVFGHNITINLEVIVMTWIVFALLIVLGLFASYKRKILPRPIQALGELIVSLLYGLTEDALGKELAKTYAPLICALFMFLLLSNWLGIIPHLELWGFLSPITPVLNPKGSRPISKNIFNRSFL